MLRTVWGWVLPLTKSKWPSVSRDYTGCVGSSHTAEPAVDRAKHIFYCISVSIPSEDFIGFACAVFHNWNIFSTTASWFALQVVDSTILTVPLKYFCVLQPAAETYSVNIWSKLAGVCEEQKAYSRSPQFVCNKLACQSVQHMIKDLGVVWTLS